MRAAALALACLALACGRSGARSGAADAAGAPDAGDAGRDLAPKERLAIVRVVAEIERWSEGDAPTTGEIEEEARARLAGGRLTTDRADGATLRLSIRGGRDDGELIVLARGRIEGARSQHDDVAVGCANATGWTARATLGCALGRVVDALSAREDLRAADAGALVAALAGDDEELRRVAIDTIGERRMRAATPKVIELLAAERADVRDAALGALVALRDRAAVPAITQMADLKDIDLMRRVIDAVGQIGGSEARAYLEFLATGHDVPAVRELARQASERLARREPLVEGRSQ